MRAKVSLAVVAVALGLAPVARAADPLCLGTYSSLPARPGPALRLGVDPGLAGSAGGVQLPVTADDPARDLAAASALRVPGHRLVVRLNRLFESDGEAGITRFAADAGRYARAGLEVEIQVRYHPSAAQNGDLAAWTRYVRRVVDVIGRIHGVVAMTITNEVNIGVSPNTSDGAYQGADDALIEGIEAAHDEAARDRLPGLRFGFTYAYRFGPPGDAALFGYLRAHGGAAFVRALGFVGVDFYPGSFYPPAMVPGSSYTMELAQAAGVVRDCLAPLAGIPASVPLWFTELGVPVGLLSEAGQAAALTELVHAAQAYAGTYGITDLRWFNLRDSIPEGPAGVIGPLFTNDGLLRADYTRKPAFAAFRSGLAVSAVAPGRPARPRARRRPAARRRCNPAARHPGRVRTRSAAMPLPSALR